MIQTRIYQFKFTELYDHRIPIDCKLKRNYYSHSSDFFFFILKNYRLCSLWLNKILQLAIVSLNKDLKQFLCVSKYKAIPPTKFNIFTNAFPCLMFFFSCCFFVFLFFEFLFLVCIV